MYSRCASLVLCLLLTASIATAASDPVISHQTGIQIEIDEHSLVVRDRLDLPPGLDHLRLGADLEIQSIRGLDNAEMDPQVTVDLVTPGDGEDPYLRLDLEAMDLDQGGILFLKYAGTFHQPTDDVVFSRENVGAEITATIGDEGVYLSASAGWLAWNPETMATHDVTLDTPAGFETVTQGYRSEHRVDGDRLHTRWVANHPSDGLNLIANRFFVHEEESAPGVTGYTFFLEDDARLRATYLERTRAYLEMYQEMIGPYPYAKFATVENWFPTGYGMPSYTLLGGQVLRLPFIPTTSFGHEIAHNWWGNSVFVDIDQGNWCEGLTSYCADYHYKTLESDEAAREYRRNLLKDYAAYVSDPDQDFPLVDFRSRHSGATRAVGYGKSMMVFHMMDQAVGRENFLNGLREVAATRMFQQAAWSDFLDEVGASGDVDLKDFGDQWLKRTGAPSLALEDVRFEKDRVEFVLVQAEPAYVLDLPVHLESANGSEVRSIRLEKTRQEFSLKVSDATRLAVDPDYHVFRRLEPGEIEPTIRQVLGEENPTFVASSDTDAARAFAVEFAESEEPPFNADGTLPTTGGSVVVIGPDPELIAAYAVEGLVISGKTLFLDGKRYSLDQFDLVFAARAPGDRQATDLVVISDSGPRLEGLARRVGHYGKYSWLLLPHGQGRVLRGNWDAGGSSLVVNR